jgi:hypothetical protein
MAYKGILPFFVLLVSVVCITTNKPPSISIVTKKISKTNPFSQNLNKTFSWTDPQLQQRLWAGLEHGPELETPHHQLEKRALPRVFGPAWRVVSCLGCAKLFSDSAAVDLLAELSTEYLTSKMILHPGQLWNKCVFYTSRNQTLYPPSNPLAETRLSDRATRWACQNNYVSIWVSSAVFFCWNARTNH